MMDSCHDVRVVSVFDTRIFLKNVEHWTRSREEPRCILKLKSQSRLGGEGKKLVFRDGGLCWRLLNCPCSSSLPVLPGSAVKN